MPELPEVETIKNNLLNIVKNKKIIDVKILRDSIILNDKIEFINSIKNKTIKDITRIGKFLIFHLDDDICFLSHLRMEGKYYQFKQDEKDSKYARVVFYFDDGNKLCYDDSRCFGIMKLSNEKDILKEKEIAKLGLEPFDIKDPNYLYQKTKNKNIPIKTFLLDQSVMAGLGNIYVDEVLFKTKIHPLNKPSSLTIDDCKNIIDNSIITLNKAIKAGGSTIKSYHPGKGIDGNFQVQLQVYGKKGEPCPICQHPLRKIKVNGRGTTYCPICQPYKNKTLNIAIYGPSGVGKSEVVNIFKDLGCDVLKCDDIVKNLYESEKVKNDIEAMFDLKFENNKVDKNILREYLNDHLNDKIKLEKYVHPLVKKKIEDFLKNSIFDIRVVEIPLLFESKMETMFDYLIAVSSKNADQMLNNRDPKAYTQIKNINSTTKFLKTKKEADFIIENDSNLASLNVKVNDIFNILKSRQN